MQPCRSSTRNCRTMHASASLNSFRKISSAPPNAASNATSISGNNPSAPHQNLMRRFFSTPFHFGTSCRFVRFAFCIDMAKSPQQDKRKNSEDWKHVANRISLDKRTSYFIGISPGILKRKFLLMYEFPNFIGVNLVLFYFVDNFASILFAKWELK